MTTQNIYGIDIIFTDDITAIEVMETYQRESDEIAELLAELEHEDLPFHIEHVNELSDELSAMAEEGDITDEFHEIWAELEAEKQQVEFLAMVMQQVQS